jgi:hypothetical protein
MGIVRFQPTLGHTFWIDADHVKMPANWQVNLDTDDIATDWFPSSGAAITQMSPSATSIPAEAMMKMLLGLTQQSIAAESLIATTLNPTTFGMSVAAAVNNAVDWTQVGVGIDNAITNTPIPVLQAGIPTQTMHATRPGSTGGVAGVTERGLTSKRLLPLMAAGETIHGFIEELPKTFGKIPRLGATWNTKILPPEVKLCCDAAQDPSIILTCETICPPCTCPAEHGTAGLKLLGIDDEIC